AADAAVLALKLLAGKDPGLPPGMGVLMGPPVPNVLIGGFPCPPVGEMAVSGLMKMLKSVAKSIKNFRNARRGNGKTCNGTHPIYLITGENYDSYVDFVSEGMFRWERHYSSGRQRLNGPLGYGNRHYYQRSLRVRLHKITYTDWDGQDIVFPRFEKGADVTRSNGYVLTRVRRGRYQLSYRDEPVMEFSGGEFDGALPLRKLSSKGRELELGYDDRGRLASFTEWQWEPRKETRYELRYDRDDRITDLYEMPFVAFGAPASSAPQPLLRAAYAYSRAGDLTDARDALGGKWKYELDWFHRLVKQTDPRGYSYTFKYDAASRCVWASGEDGLWWAEVKYFPEKKKTVYTEGENATWELLYDDDGFLHTLIDPHGGKSLRKRDAEGKVVEVIDSGGRVLQLLYDANGANVGRMDRFGFVHPPELEQADPGDPFERTLPHTPRARLYDGLADAGQDAARGASGPLLQSIPPEFAQWAPGTFRLRAREFTPLPEARIERDALGRVTAEVDHAGRRRERTFDPTGNLVLEIDTDGRAREERTTSWNLVGERRSAVGGITRYRYSKLEQVISVVDANDNVTRYDYDLKERLVRVARIGKVRETYEYDGGDRLVRKLDGEGRVLFENEHDRSSSFVSVRRLASGGEHRFRYDRSGRIVEASTDRHEVLLRRDAHGRPTADLCDGVGVTHHALVHRGGAQHAHALRERVTRVLARFELRARAWDHETTQLVAPDGSETFLTLDASGLVLRRCNNGSQELTQYDDLGRLEARMLWQGEPGAMRGWTVRYEWSNEGELGRISDSMRGTTGYRYDDAHRLVAETTPNGVRLELELDGADALRFKHDVGRMELAAGNRLLASDDETFQYDGRDHLSVRRRRTTGESTRYLYDAFDMLVRVERTGPSPLVSSFEYDAIGRRIVARHGESVRRFVWDGDRLAAEIAPSGALRIYQYASPSALVPITFTDFASVDAPASSGRTHQVFSDPSGQPLVVQDEHGHVVWFARRVDPYGGIEIAPDAVVELNLRWPGHYFDPETGLHYNRHRYYDPRLGRYLQTDPLGYGGSPSHLYGAPTNPLRDVDVLGLAHPDVANGSTSKKGSGDNDGSEDPPGFQRTRPGSPDGKVPPLELEGAQLQKLKAAHQQHLDDASQANPNAGHIKNVSPEDIDLARQPGATPEQIDARRRILTEFVSPQDVNDHINGHDLTQPLFVGPPPTAPSQQTQYQINQDRAPGQYFADSGFTPDELGIAGQGKNGSGGLSDKQPFATSNDPNTPYLQSSNAATYDVWSQKPTEIWTHGGGVQRVYTHQNGGKSWL
ncbi:MAG: RHS repeat-associated core domain-containing protein, partial [Deltaproteobacteria bacterium]|nr:RHS repeat-associated core domain-containing protein [Deltaproteobacteria bacterium]